MTIAEYNNYFEDILEQKHVQPPYNNKDYVNYVKLNKTRTKRWEKKGEILPDAKEVIKAIDSPQTWVLITEPWCGDAANLVPLIDKLASLNPNITLQIQLRDSDSEIDNYLTNGGKSIPKLIARDKGGNDIFTWGPRPAEAQGLAKELKESNAPLSEKMSTLLTWYREDNGVSMQKEILDLLG